MCREPQRLSPLSWHHVRRNAQLLAAPWLALRPAVRLAPVSSYRLSPQRAIFDSDQSQIMDPACSCAPFHLYCGHLGTPNGRWWPDRQNLSLAVREFEAESVCYLVCARLGIDTASDEYLAGYVRRCRTTPPISLDRVMKSVWLLEQMGWASLGLRKPAN
jgi:hypothetical protein